MVTLANTQQSGGTPSVVMLVYELFESAIEENASDIHLEPLQHTCRIRFRIDGLLHEHRHIDHPLSQRIASRIKVLANLDTSKQHLPQDGRFTIESRNGIARDCRLSTCPSLFGEKVVIRLLNTQSEAPPPQSLGLQPKQLATIRGYLTKQQGMIIVSGPTGSGKTTSLYSLLAEINSPQKNIMTVEDPIEMPLDGICQVNVNMKTGLSFSKVLRSFLRLDPDIMMVGEIRDTETAQIAIRAAQTGHLVLSTIHTNSATETLPYLQEMGIAPFNIASAVSLVIAQRLLRRLGADTDNTRQYAGRIGIFELLPMTEHIRRLVLTHQPSPSIAAQAKREGWISLQESALALVKQGLTNIEEVYRVLGSTCRLG